MKVGLFRSEYLHLQGILEGWAPVAVTLEEVGIIDFCRSLGKENEVLAGSKSQMLIRKA